MALRNFREDPRRARLEALSAPAIKKEVKSEAKPEIKNEISDLKAKPSVKKVEK